MHKYIKTLILTSIAATSLIMFAKILQGMPFVNTIPYSLKIGISAGIALTLWAAIPDFLEALKHGKDPDKYKTRQLRQLTLNMSYNDSFKHAKWALGEIGAYKKKEDKENGIIKGYTGFTWKSFGEKIEMKLEPINDNMTAIKIESKPSLPTTLIDYGKNYENIKNLCKLITESKAENLR